MTDIKLHMEVEGNVLDVEGDKALVEKIYNDFKQQLSGDAAGLSSGVPIAAQPVPDSSVIAARPQFTDGSDQGAFPRANPAASDVAPLVAMTHDPALAGVLAEEVEAKAD